MSWICEPGHVETIHFENLIIKIKEVVAKMTAWIVQTLVRHQWERGTLNSVSRRCTTWIMKQSHDSKSSTEQTTRLCRSCWELEVIDNTTLPAKVFDSLSTKVKPWPSENLTHIGNTRNDQFSRTWVMNDIDHQRISLCKRSTHLSTQTITPHKDRFSLSYHQQSRINYQKAHW